MIPGGREWLRHTGFGAGSGSVGLGVGRAGEDMVGAVLDGGGQTNEEEKRSGGDRLCAGGDRAAAAVERTLTLMIMLMQTRVQPFGRDVILQIYSIYIFF